MVARGFGRIVCISSVLGLVPNPITTERMFAYGTSKAAIIGFVRQCAAAALGPAVRVNGVAPGYVETDMTADVSDEAHERLDRRGGPQALRPAGGDRRAGPISC